MHDTCINPTRDSPIRLIEVWLSCTVDRLLEQTLWLRICCGEPDVPEPSYKEIVAATYKSSNYPWNIQYSPVVRTYLLYAESAATPKIRGWCRDSEGASSMKVEARDDT